MKPQESRLGYVMIINPVPSMTIGGIMVVDGRGLPLEFRYTEPIEPSKLQQILYGQALERYIKTDVVLTTLLKSIEVKPHLLMVNEDTLLDAEYEGYKEIPVIRLSETRSRPLGAAGTVEVISAQEYLCQLTDESHPLRIQTQGRHDATPQANSAKTLPSKPPVQDIQSSKSYQLITALGPLLDLVEPMQRIEKALNELCQEAGIRETVA